jgi:hypothetical protein
VAKTPMDEKLKLSKASTMAKVDATRYHPWSALPDSHATGNCLYRGLCEQVHGRSKGGSLGCGQTLVALHQGKL